MGEIFPHSGKVIHEPGSGFFPMVILLVSFRLLYGNDFLLILGDFEPICRMALFDLASELSFEVMLFCSFS